MALGSLVDAGADTAELTTMLERLPIGGWSLSFAPCLRAGLAATRAVVLTREERVVRTYMHIVGLIEEAHLPARVRDRALSAFSALAGAEGSLHRRPASQVHFHEVGGIDAVVDVVGSAAALELLGIDEVASSPVAQGSGVLRSAHGLLPNPPPAVVALLAGAPTLGRDVDVELTTPTGAAMLRAWSASFGPMPDLVVEAAGYGAGARELAGIPNCTQVIVGLSTAVPAGGLPDGSGRLGLPLVQLEANLDDVTGEILAWAVAELLDSGALDAWITPVVMKHGRPAQVLSVLAEPVLVRQLIAVMMSATGTLGVRARTVERVAAERSVDQVEVEGGTVRVKVSPGRVKAEHSDVAALAESTGIPVMELQARAEAAWRRRSGEGGTPGRRDLNPRPPGA